MYGHYCCHNNNMNWLMGIGLLFNTIGSMFSGKPQRAYYPVYNMPLFSYSAYPPNSPPAYQQRTNPFLVGNLLSGIDLDAVPLNYPARNNSSLLSIIQQTKQNQAPQVDNLVGNTLLEIANSQTAAPEASAALPKKQKKPNNPTVVTPKKTLQIPKPQTRRTVASNNRSSDTIIRNGEHVKISKDIEGRVKQIAAKVNCDYRDLLGLIWAESRFNPTAWNGKTAVGLIQFTQICIDDLNKVYGLNLTKQKIAKMSVFEQLDLTEKTLIRAKQVAGLPQSYRMNAAELYTINFLPGRLKTHANKGYLTKRGENFYAQNTGADINKDNYITKEELSQFIQRGRKYVTTIA